MEVAGISLFLDGAPVDGSEMYGDNPYHNVVCMVIYVCHTTVNFHLRFMEKISNLDQKFGNVQVFIPSCPPDLAHVVYMVQYLKKLNPEAELLFGTDDIQSFDSMATAKVSLAVMVAGCEGLADARDSNFGKMISDRIRKEENVRLRLLEKGNQEALKRWEENIYGERKQLIEMREEQEALMLPNQHPRIKNRERAEPGKADNRFRVVILKKGQKYVTSGSGWYKAGY